jgi:hypothetical protein
MAGVSLRALILSSMAATTQELALRYLLELSVDIHAAALVDRDGSLIASAPDSFGGRAAGLARELAGEARAFGPQGAGAVEIDVSVEDGSVFIICGPEHSMICVTGRSVLPGLIFHDMHAVLNDLDRAAAQEARRTPIPLTGRPRAAEG